jgi:G3E family GTPase
MNEFADTGDIEGDIVPSQVGFFAETVCVAKAINVSSPESSSEGSEEFLELSNGCLCCSVKNSGAAAIEKLMEKKGAFDYILLEVRVGFAPPHIDD